jgi:hypothetical protein
MSELVSKELVQEIVECIQSCNWSCQEEIECYMHSAINDTDEYEPEDWLYGKGKKWLEAQNN